MGIEFNILWFEDNEDWLNSIKSDVEEKITNRHFTPKITCFPNTAQLENLKDQIHTFHLILTDLKLDDGSTGTDVIKFFRENDILADVLFYSGDGVARIKEVMQNSALEGVYTAPRDGDSLIEKLQMLIDKTIVRFETPSSMRNHLINYVADNDLILKNFIKDSIDCETTNKYCLKLLTEYQDNTDKKIKGIKETSKSVLNQSLEQRLLDSDKISRVFHKVLEIKNISGLFTHEEYRIDILKKRNDLSHDSTTIYSPKECADIRENMRKYKEWISTQIK